ncbi:MAG: RecQ family ATP-dependent DNA helicase [Eubacteriaceae bacterium]|nr:RecQ family ATP-dependent DNA helicase [Eubacteriaceae bacterium]
MHDTEELIKLAYQDIALWATAISKLLKMELQLPAVSFTGQTENADIDIDFSMKKRYTDEYVNAKQIQIRTEYYLGRDYYRVANSDSLKYRFEKGDTDNDLPTMEFLLKNIFGFNEFRDGQVRIIKNILERNDTIGILPTGVGKSLCYQFACLLQPGVALVIAPIISLMLDQKLGMNNLGLARCEHITSQDPGNVKGEKLNRFIEGKYQILMMSPERFQSKKFRESLTHLNRNMNFSTAVIDEAHCLSEWGHDFRVSYLALIRTIKEYCPEARLLGLTATASKLVLQDLKIEFNVGDGNVKTIDSMKRDELVFKRITVTGNNKKIELFDTLKELNKIFGCDVTENTGEKTKAGMIFSSTIGGPSGCIKICNEINAGGYAKKGNKGEKIATTYYGRMKSKEKAIAQMDFINNKYPIMVCTKAFGMGIDKSNVKYTIHYGLPQSIESFYQEAGRAGRDADKSEKSYCYILYSPERISDHIKEELFSSEISILKRKKLCEVYLHNDLSTLFYFWRQNKKTEEEELNDTLEVFMEIHRGDSILEFNNKDKPLQKIQEALYKLSILGIVKNWIVEYSDSDLNGQIEVEYSGCERIEVENALLRYIRKYDEGFRLDGNSKRYKLYRDILNSKGKMLPRYIYILISWTNANIMYQRLQSTKYMMDWCSPRITDQEFARRLEHYFIHDEITANLDFIVYDPLDYENWFNILFETKNVFTEEIPITKERGDTILISLQRYLESYRYNPGLNFLSGILGLYCNPEQYYEWKQRLKVSFENIRDMDIEKQEVIIRRTLNFAQQFDIDNKDKLSEMILSFYPEEVKEVCSMLHDRYSLQIVINNYNKQFEEIFWKDKKWII